MNTVVHVTAYIECGMVLVGTLIFLFSSDAYLLRPSVLSAPQKRFTGLLSAAAIAIIVGRVFGWW